MSRAAIVAVLLFLACAAIGIYAGLEIGAANDREVRLQADYDRLAGEFAELQRSFERQAAELEELRRQRDRAVADLRRRSARESVDPVTGEPTPSVRVDDGRDPVVLQRLVEADATAQQLAEKGDIVGLLELAAELLALGEPGYEKLIELGAVFDQDEPAEKNLNLLWRHEEQMMGSFLRAVSANQDDVLRFALYLERRGAEGLPTMMHAFRDGMQDEFGVVMLGLYEGDDPEVLGGFVDIYAEKLSGDLTKVRHGTDMIRALGQIPTEEATDVLLDRLPDATPRMQMDIIRALAWQRNPRALTFLRQLRNSTAPGHLLEVIEAAIRHLE